MLKGISNIDIQKPSTSFQGQTAFFSFFCLLFTMNAHTRAYACMEGVVSCALDCPQVKCAERRRPRLTYKSF